MSKGYIKYATTNKLPEAIKEKKNNIQAEIKRMTGVNVKVSEIQTQKYVAEMLKRKIKFDIDLWNRIVSSK